MNTKVKNLVILLITIFPVFSMSCCCAVSVGDSLYGGTVFCVSKTSDIEKCETTGSGDHGLIMAYEDQANRESNSKGGVTWSVATWLCHTYKRSKIEGHNDWRLPYKDELDKMYIYAKANKLIGKSCTGSKVNGVQCLVGGGYSDIKAYWSSSPYVSEYSDFGNSAWCQYFDDGLPYCVGKDNSYLAVRAVRVFNNNSANQQFNKKYI